MQWSGFIRSLFEEADPYLSVKKDMGVVKQYPAVWLLKDLIKGVCTEGGVTSFQHLVDDVFSGQSK